VISIDLLGLYLYIVNCQPFFNKQSKDIVLRF